jgi:threonine aldolase
VGTFNLTPMASTNLIDLRSDTVTRPTPEMLAAMFAAPVGDDVFGEDPTVNALQEKAAALFGMEAALFCPSGTMTNQIAFKVLTRPGDEVIIEENAHPYKYEGGGLAVNSGLSVALIQGDRGRITAAQVEARINNPDDVHFPLTRVVSLENTCNRGGGAIYDFAEILKIREVCDRRGLALHLDGARLFNALVETQETPADFGRVFDTISICLSKGLGAPVGSLLLGTQDRIKAARRVRKVFGGGMRQAGFLAAAGIYALDHHVTRLREDHACARALGQEVQAMPFVAELFPVDTNILVFRLQDGVSVPAFLAHMASEGVKAVAFGGQLVRFVTHLDFQAEMIPLVAAAMGRFRG